MASFTALEVLFATRAAGVQTGPSRFSGVSTDSRAVGPGELFVALEGERFDGHAYLAECAARGATGAVVRRGKARAATPAGFALFEVEEPLRALAGLATLHRQRFELPVASVGGSNGKTTTKEMVAAILATRGPALATQGNLNNEIGVPLTVLRLDESHRSAVIELGMNHAGEVDRLVSIARPQVGIVTVVQPEHLEGLGSLEGVAHAEGELYRGLPQSGIAVANVDDALALREARESGRSLLGFGMADSADVRLLGIDAHDAQGLRFRIGHAGRSWSASVPHVGSHNAMNACGAFAVGIALGFTPEACLEGLARSGAASRRLNVKATHAGGTLLDDCYNANPGSMAAALEALAALAKGKRAVAVLGDMLELGAEESEAHAQLGTDVAKLAGVEALLFGPRSRLGVEAARKAGLSGARHSESVEELAGWMRALDGKDVVFLVKGSRGMKMERLVAALVGEAPASGH